jgi:predicted enzyme related to lactoylglutathione lyase
MFIQVPEAKTTKNRMHVDLTATDRTHEVERLLGLGATVVHENDERGTRWTTLADPEGNEFCVAEN